jgi:hypothetical protein
MNLTQGMSVLGECLVLYVIEVCREDVYRANKIFTSLADSPEEYVSFRLQRVNNKAFKHAITLAAQIQNDSRMIIVENVTEESYFIFKSQIQSVSDVISFYHDNIKQVIRIIVQFNDFKKFEKSYNNP